MELHQIETNLNSPNPQNRMKAITELRHYESGLVVPLLKGRMYGPRIYNSFLCGYGFGV